MIVNWRLFVLSILLTSAAGAQEKPPAQVMVVGTYHMANPGQDLHNMEADDVLQPERQAQIHAVVEALANFEPSLVAVEWPADVTDERYRQYLADELEPSRNEVVQLGFRLAERAGLDRVHGIDVEGAFPFGAVQEWAQANGREDELEALNAEVAERVKELQAMQASHTVGELLRANNTPEYTAWGHGFYMRLLEFGEGEEQPGAQLLSAWAERNYEICARLLQALEPDDRAVVFYGSGHNYYLRRCAIDTPSVELVEANAWLPPQD
jgi:hypothetical protein